MALRDALHPHHALWRKLLLGLAAVAAIVAGLLAMHSLNLESHHNEVVIAEQSETVLAQPVVFNEHHHTDSAGVANVADDTGICDGACGMDSMLGACILALLVTSGLLAGAATISRSATIRHALVRSIVAAASLVPAAPPSLHVLSISRT